MFFLVSGPGGAGTFVVLLLFCVFAEAVWVWVVAPGTADALGAAVAPGSTGAPGSVVFLAV